MPCACHALEDAVGDEAHVEEADERPCEPEDAEEADEGGEALFAGYFVDLGEDGEVGGEEEVEEEL